MANEADNNDWTKAVVGHRPSEVNYYEWFHPTRENASAKRASEDVELAV
jgi:hypothetical protein